MRQSDAGAVGAAAHVRIQVDDAIIDDVAGKISDILAMVDQMQAQDTDSGQAGIMLAEYLGLPCVSNVIDIQVTEDQHITVSRLGDAGTEVVQLELPAVVTVSDSINEPRLPQMRGIMMAKKKPIEVMDLAALGISATEIGGADPTSEIVEFMASKTREAGKKFEGDAADFTAQVVDLLANEASVL